MLLIKIKNLFFVGKSLVSGIRPSVSDTFPEYLFSLPLFTPTFSKKSELTEDSSISPFTHAPKKLYNTGKAICGAQGCTRACMISLEKRGLLKNKFENPFRTSKPWSVDWSADPFDTGYVAPYDRIDFESPNQKKEKTDTD